jgi:hypothetical protein
MWKPGPNTRDHENDPVIMAMKRGVSSMVKAGLPA